MLYDSYLTIFTVGFECDYSFVLSQLFRTFVYEKN